jgi:hypothetical protein
MNMNVTMGLDVFVMIILATSGLSVVIYSEWVLKK